MYKRYVDFASCVIWNGKGGSCLLFKDFPTDFGEISFNLQFIKCKKMTKTSF